MTGQPVSVLVAEDDPDTAEALGQLLSSTPSLAMAGWARDGAGAAQLALALRPDVVLMDLRMPGVDGLAATRMLVRHCRDDRPRVLVLTAFVTDSYLLQSLAAGASGFLAKDAPWKEVANAILAVSEGEAVVPPGLLRRLVDSFLPIGPAVELSLTPREREVLVLVGEGRDNVEITKALCISMATVKTHIAHLRDKLGARDRVRLALMARQGLMTAPLEHPIPDRLWPLAPTDTSVRLASLASHQRPEDGGPCHGRASSG